MAGLHRLMAALQLQERWWELLFRQRGQIRQILHPWRLAIRQDDQDLVQLFDHLVGGSPALTGPVARGLHPVAADGVPVDEALLAAGSASQGLGWRPLYSLG